MILFLYLAIISFTFATVTEPSEWTCGQAFQVNATHSATIVQSHLDFNMFCKWELIGDKGCEVEVSCNIDLPENVDCEENHLLITDGYRGSQKYCGKTNPEGIRASKGLRDLFLILSTDGIIPGGNNFTGISCTAKCASNPNLEAGRLPQNWERNLDHRCVCGLLPKNDRIVGGEDAKYNEFPWLIAIVVKGTRYPLCGGSIINDRFILTAAHCPVVSGKKAHELEVLVRAHVLDMRIMEGFENDTILQEDTGPGFILDRKTDKDEKTERMDVQEIIKHPLFTAGNDYDFSLLRLKNPINLADSEAPIPVCLPPADTFDSFELEGKNFTVAGWGLHHEHAKATTRLLQKLVVPHISRHHCMQYLSKFLTRRMTCFGFKNGMKDACKYDSGGPLIYKLPSKQWWQMGIVSFGQGCARAMRPGVYTQVTEGTQWIHFHAALHDAEWCKDDAITVLDN